MKSVIQPPFIIYLLSQPLCFQGISDNRKAGKYPASLCNGVDESDRAYQKWNGTAWVKDTEAEKLFRIREAEETKNSLMQVASEHIAPLQDAADLEIATEEEISLLEAWKKYRVLLNRVNTTTAPDIEWPVAPIG